MISFRNFLMLLAATSLLFACTPNGNGSDDTDNCHDDGGIGICFDDRPDKDPIAFSFDVKVLGESVVVGVWIDGEYAGESDEEFELDPAGAPYTVQIGDGDSWTGGGISEEENPRPITNIDGVRWMYTDIEVSESSTQEVHLRRYFGHNYACTREVCVYDPSKPDKKGNCGEPIEDDPQYIEVVNGHLLLAHENGTFNTFTTYVHLDVVIDRLEMPESNGFDERLEDSWISDDDRFGMEVVQQETGIVFTSCDPV